MKIIQYITSGTDTSIMKLDKEIVPIVQIIGTMVTPNIGLPIDGGDASSTYRDLILDGGSASS